MAFQWFCQRGTITIECFLPSDHWLQWFFSIVIKMIMFYQLQWVLSGWGKLEEEVGAASQSHLSIIIITIRPQRSIATIASFDQWSITSKTIESNGKKIKNHGINHWWQWLDCQKNIQWWWSSQKPLKRHWNQWLGSPKTMVIVQRCQNHWGCAKLPERLINTSHCQQHEWFMMFHQDSDIAVEVNSLLASWTGESPRAVAGLLTAGGTSAPVNHPNHNCWPI